jgi:hypothetical protein
MKTLSLNLEDSLTKQFENLSPAEKSRIEKLMGNVLAEIFRRERNKALFDILDKTATQAEKNGMTIAKLAELMEWDEETVRNLFGEEVTGNGR